MSPASFLKDFAADTLRVRYSCDPCLRLVKTKKTPSHFMLPDAAVIVNRFAHGDNALPYTDFSGSVSQDSCPDAIQTVYSAG